MKLVVGLGCIDDYIPYANAGADECFIGYIPEIWMEHFPNSCLNRREVRYYNVQIGSMSELLILRDMIHEVQVPVSIAFNAPGFTEKERALAFQIIEECRALGFSDTILADGPLVQMLPSGVHLSGEYGELNHLILESMQAAGVKRIIFPRQTTIEEMEKLIRLFPDFEYEAFLLNERCQFTGAYCNSLHCDELCHACKIPYRLSGAMKTVASGDSPSVVMHENRTNTLTEVPPDEYSGDYLLGESGCGLCKLWKFRQIGISHLKVVSRGNDTESTLMDLRAVTRALEILDESDSEEAFLRRIKAELFPVGCSGNCY